MMDEDHNYNFPPHDHDHDQYPIFDNNNIIPTRVTNSFDLLLSTSNIQLLPYQATQQSQSAHIDLDIDWTSLLYGYNKYDQQSTTTVSFMANRGSGSELRENYGSKNKSKYSKDNKPNPPRIAFHTRSVDDVLDDGYKWRKYGQKSVKNNVHPRRYFRCIYPTCNVKKQIQRLSKDPSIVVTTYEGIHNHPCAKLMETLSPLIKQLQFLSRI